MRPVSFINSLMEGQLSTLRMCGTVIASIDEAPYPADQVVDLEGARLLPGLINAHDHLQLNSLPPLDFTTKYQNVRGWIADINVRRQSDAQFEAQVGVRREIRLLIGAMKNLLCGVTTVAHHDPLYPGLTAAEFPVAVVDRYGWAHSLYIDGETAVRDSYRATPAARPWIIHAAEGIDVAAVDEWSHLERLGCAGANTVVVHGVGLDDESRLRLERAGSGLVWCPASNLRLFGRTAEVTDLIGSGRVALGTDSRLSGSRDLLDELRLVGEISDLDEPAMQSLVTSAAARVLRLPDRGALRAGLRADLVVLRRGVALKHACRTDIQAVVREGRPRFGDEKLMQTLVPEAQWWPVHLDGERKALDPALAELLLQRGATETGLALSAARWRAA